MSKTPQSWTWFDAETHETFSDSEHDVVDANGQLLVGEDEDGFWWGTPRALWVVGDDMEGAEWDRRGRTPEVFTVHGFLGSSPYTMYLMTANAQAAKVYAECHGMQNPIVTSGLDVP